MLKVEKESQMGEFTLLVVSGDRGTCGSLQVPNKKVLALTCMLEANVSGAFMVSKEYQAENLTAVVVGDSNTTYGNLMLSHTEAQELLKKASGQ
jgi:hypothetical protein